MTLNLEFDSGQIQLISFIRQDDPSITEYNLTITKTGDGTLYPYEGTRAQAIGDIIAINAVADTDNNFRFGNWTINGIVDENALTTVEIDRAIVAIANFIKQYEVTTSASGGTVDPELSGLYDENEVIELTAIPDDIENGMLDYWEVNTINIGNDNPLQYTVTETADIVAFFKGVINYIQDVFGTVPVGQVFEDQSFNGNDVTYKNVQVGTFEGTLRMSPQLPLIPTSDVVIKIRFSTTEIGINQALVSQYISGTIGRFQLFISNTNGIRLFIGGTPNVDVTAGVIVPNTVYDVEFERFGNLYTVKLNGLLIISTESSTDILQTSSTSICSFDAGGLPLTLRGNLYYFEIEGVCEYTLQDNIGNIIYNKLGNNNHSFITNAILEDFRGTYVDNHDSGLIENGYSKYLVNTVAGTTVTLADPEGNNLGIDKVVNGDFSDGVNSWESVRNGIPTVVDGRMRPIYSTSGTPGVEQDISLIIGKTYEVTVDCFIGTIPSYDCRLGEASQGISYGRLTGTTDKSRKIFITATTDKLVIGLYSPTSSDINSYAEYDNVTVKEVTSIPAYGEGEISINKETVSTTYYYFIKNNLEVYPNFIAYGILISAQLAVKLISINSGSVTTLVASSDNYIDLNTNYIYKWQRNETVDQYFIGAADSLRLSIKGGVYTDWTIIGTVIDNIITEMKYNECIASTGDEISHISKDSIKYDLDNFIDTTGEYDVVYVTGLNDGSSDAKGNEIEIPKNVVSNNKITYDGVQVVGIETDATFTDIHNLENSSVVEIIKDTLTVSNLKIIE